MNNCFSFAKYTQFFTFKDKNKMADKCTSNAVQKFTIAKDPIWSLSLGSGLDESNKIKL